MTVHGLGSIPSDHYLSLNMLGMHGTVYANYAVNEADFFWPLAFASMTGSPEAQRVRQAREDCSRRHRRFRDQQEQVRSHPD